MCCCCFHSGLCTHARTHNHFAYLHRSPFSSTSNDDDDNSEIKMDSMSCARCDDGFEPRSKIVNSNGDLFHPRCFV